MKKDSSIPRCIAGCGLPSLPKASFAVGQTPVSLKDGKKKVAVLLAPLQGRLHRDV